MYSWAWVPKQGGVEEGGVGGILIFYRGESNSYGGLIKYLLPGIFALFQELLLRTLLTRGAARRPTFTKRSRTHKTAQSQGREGVKVRLSAATILTDDMPRPDAELECEMCRDGN